MRKPRLPPPLTDGEQATHALSSRQRDRGLPTAEMHKKSSKAKKTSSRSIPRPPSEPPPGNAVSPGNATLGAVLPSTAASSEAVATVLPKLLLSQVTRLPRPDPASPSAAAEVRQRLAARWIDYPTQLGDEASAATDAKSADPTDGAAGATGTSSSGDDSLAQLDV
jgi:hypothetical protein